jgi:muramoyltetrapeptide carboxypeptidase
MPLRRVAEAGALAMSPSSTDQPLKGPRLRAGDRVRIVSPSSPPDRRRVERGARVLEEWGLRVEFGRHAFDQYGHFLAGRDEDRLADVNDALRDPGVRAIFTTRGGKGAYRIAHGLDFEACRKDPKPLLGFSDTTSLHLAFWKECRVSGFHSPHIAEDRHFFPRDSALYLRRALMAPESVIVHQDPKESSALVTIEGAIATGYLVGGTLGSIARAVGSTCPSFAGAILFIETIDTFIGQIDGALTQLRRSGCLEGLRGVAVGQFIRSAEPRRGAWSFIDVLRDQLGELGVPVLGGLPIGHGPTPRTIPLGTLATLDTAGRTLTVEAGVH